MTAALIIAIVAQVIGAVGSAVSSSIAGDATAKYHEGLAKSQDKQADLVLASAERKQQYINEGASRQSQATRDKFKSIQGAQKVSYAANGIAGQSATAMEVELNSLELSNRDEELIRFNANMAAWETNNEATITAEGLRDEAAGNREAAAGAREAAKQRMWMSLLGGGAGIASTIGNASSGGKR